MSQELQAADFSLAPLDFVSKLFQVKLGEAGAEKRRDIEYLAYRLTQGASRLDIINAVDRLAGKLVEDDEKVPGVLFQDRDGFLSYDLLEGFAPDDHDAFIDFCANRILDKALPDPIRTQASFELRKGGSRREFIESLTKLACFDGRDVNVFEYGRQESVIKLDQQVLKGGDGSDELVFARRYRGDINILSSFGWHQPMPAADGGCRVAPGWLFSGPKRNLKSGAWQVSVDLSQDQGASLMLDVVADCGMTSLLKVELAGSCLASFNFSIKPEHSFVEVRLLRVEAAGEGIIRINNFMLKRIA